MATAEFEREIPAAEREGAIASLARQLARFLPGVALEVRVRRRTRKRSDLQNRALWGVAYEALRQQTGNDKDDLHLFFCGDFFGWATYELMGEKRKRPRRTTTRDEEGKHDPIDVGLMADFYDHIQRRAAENGYDVPDPDPLWWEKVA